MTNSFEKMRCCIGCFNLRVKMVDVDSDDDTEAHAIQTFSCLAIESTDVDEATQSAIMDHFKDGGHKCDAYIQFDNNDAECVTDEGELVFRDIGEEYEYLEDAEDDDSE